MKIKLEQLSLIKSSPLPVPPTSLLHGSPTPFHFRMHSTPKRSSRCPSSSNRSISTCSPANVSPIPFINEGPKRWGVPMSHFGDMRSRPLHIQPRQPTPISFHVKLEQFDTPKNNLSGEERRTKKQMLKKVLFEQQPVVKLEMVVEQKPVVKPPKMLIDQKPTVKPPRNLVTRRVVKRELVVKMEQEDEEVFEEPPAKARKPKSVSPQQPTRRIYNLRPRKVVDYVAINRGKKSTKKEIAALAEQKVAQWNDRRSQRRYQRASSSSSSDSE